MSLSTSPESDTHLLTSRRVVRLNVGGTVFSTSALTLSTRPGVLASVAAAATCNNGDDKPDNTDNIDADRPLFIDRSPLHFPLVLAFLRDGVRAALPHTLDESGLLALKLEADYYCLNALALTCDARLKALHSLKYGVCFHCGTLV
jgi:hypothetical protein